MIASGKYKSHDLYDDLGKTGSGLDERLYYLADANMDVTGSFNTSRQVGQVCQTYYYDWTLQVDIQVAISIICELQGDRQ